MRVREQVTIAGRFSSAVSPVTGDGWTAVYAGGAGAWTVRITVPGFRLVGASAHSAIGGGYITSTASFTENTFRITNYDANGAAVEATNYTFIAVGLGA